MEHLASDLAQIYNDGSKLEGAVEFAIYLRSIGISKSMALPDHCSVFQAEVSAIKVAVKITVDKNAHRQKITILSDNKAAIEALDSRVINSKMVNDCRRYLYEMSDRYDVCITTAERTNCPEGA